MTAVRQRVKSLRLLLAGAIILPVLTLLVACGGDLAAGITAVDNDIDDDGVIDSIDQCLDTAAGAIPGADGCVYVEVSTVNNVLVGGADTDRPGYTLYVFDGDQALTDSVPGSTCNDACAETWPPLLVNDGFATGAANLTTVVRDDGTIQAAFENRPLYFYSGDSNAGETSGQGLNSAWWLVEYDGFQSPLTYPGYTLVWNDEFSGTELNLSDWSYEIGTGNGGWGNDELQYYREENTRVADGLLTIEAREESFAGSSYTSSRLVTQDKQFFRYGKVDIRAIMPSGQGMWPALWMLGQSFPSVGWPYFGEIDIMEMIGGREDTSYGTVHWDNAGSYASYGDTITLDSGTLADEFHVYSIEWDSRSIRWYLDGQQYNVIDITPANLSEFQEAFFFIFNVAVGGRFPGAPDSSTIFPQQMQVDYIRVFEKQ